METKDYSCLVDTSRPFRSVKEAVAIFGERILVGEIYAPSPKPYYTPPRSQEISWKSSSPSPRNQDQDQEQDQVQENGAVLSTLKKLEAELEVTKAELKLLKERESETEIAIASLNANLHKNMSKLAEAEAAAAKQQAQAMAARTASFIEGEQRKGEIAKRDMVMRMDEKDSHTLAQILTLGQEKGYFGRNKKMAGMTKKKKKPIVPLVGDLFFFRKKGSSNNPNNNNNNNPVHASSQPLFRS